MDVQRVPGIQDGAVMTVVTLCRTDVADPAVAVVVVVPTHEASGPGACRIEIDEAFGGELRSVLGRAEQRLGVGVGASSQLRHMRRFGDDLFG